MSHNHMSYMERNREETDLKLDRESSLSNSQEAELLKNAFLISSAIEIVSVPQSGKGKLNQSERRVLKEVAKEIEELKKADDYLSGENTLLMLQPEGVELIRVIKEYEDRDLGENLNEAVELIRLFIEIEEPLADHKESTSRLADILRSILQAIKSRIVYSDLAQDSIVSE